MSAWLRTTRGGSRLLNTRSIIQSPINTNGLIAWWNFDGNSFLDGSGNGNYAIKGAAARFSPGPYGQVLNSPGGVAATGPTTSGILSAGVPFTWMTRVFQTTLAHTGALSCLANGVSSTLAILASGALQIAATGFFTSAAKITAGQWHHIAVACTATTSTIYLDGAQIATGANPMATPLTSLALGTGGGVTAPAQYSDVRFYNRVLSVSEINAISQTPPLSQFAFPFPLFAPNTSVSVPIIGAASAFSARAPAETVFIFI